MSSDLDLKVTKALQITKEAANVEDMDATPTQNIRPSRPMRRAANDARSRIRMQCNDNTDQND